ncbi:uncharacterized protein SAPINGB_P001724 [Magnusiomyces paraingens]|uniref:Uncharacterized protein n=1 Tax=Magnusiomyces paraingens TaxID=2606893 RepID=A0A5E8B7R6_9ASCO|nr:uncharacterized protein SAPINGB_P001724 [Saprochaete ingens]VVT47464.1 unnamed protein product [Saprochaete ingens]
MDLKKEDKIVSNLGIPSSFGKTYSEDEKDATIRLKHATREQYKLIKTKQQKKTELLKNIKESQSDNSDDDDEFDDDEFNIDSIPVSHELILSGEHKKLVSSISLDPSGARLLTASYDSTFKLWDFNTMDINSHHPFRSVEPLETYQLHSALFSPNGKQILAIPRYTKPKLYDRDGIEIAEFSSGDMYLVDMKNTKGHTAEITSGAWNPMSGDLFATSSNDSTVRVWDVNNTRSQRDVIVVRSKGSRGNKVRVACVTWFKNDLTIPPIIAGTDDGSIGLWDTRNESTRPSHFIESAHSASVTAIVQRPLSQTFATRGFDGVINLWDSRQLKSPVLSRSGVKTASEDGNDIIFDPRPSTLGQYLLVGSFEGKVHVLDTSDLSTLMVIEDLVSSSDHKSFISSISWHQGLNQIITGSSNGQINVLFSPSTSHKGALTSIEKVPRRKYVDDGNLGTVNISAAGLEADITQAREKQEERLRINKTREHEDLSNPFKSKGNYRSNRSDSVSFDKTQNKGTVWNIPNQSYVRENVHLSELIHEDPREALLKYAEKAEKTPVFFKESDYSKRPLAETESEDKIKVKKRKNK